MQTTGTLKLLVKSGFMGPKSLTWYSITKRYKEIESKYPNRSKTSIVSEVATEFNMGERVTWRAISIMSSKVHNVPAGGLYNIVQ